MILHTNLADSSVAEIFALAYDLMLSSPQANTVIVTRLPNIKFRELAVWFERWLKRRSLDFKMQRGCNRSTESFSWDTDVISFHDDNWPPEAEHSNIIILEKYNDKR